MGTNINDVYYCNFIRRDELNDEIFERNRANEDLEQTFFEGPASTRQVLFPMLDCRKKSNVPIKQLPVYSTTRVFNPGYRGAYSGYNVETESKLMNKYDVLQKCPQRRYVPSSSSDLYHSDYLIPTNKRVSNKNLIQRVDRFNSFDPNKCGRSVQLGGELFNNHTRQQTKNIKLN